MKKIIYTLILVLFLAAPGKGQEICWTMENLKLMIAENPGLEKEMKAYEEELQKMLASQGDMLKSTTAVVSIPVVVHIVYNTDEQNIPDLRVTEQMTVLNNDFSGQTTHGNMGAFPSTLYANCQVQFCLAKRDPQGNPTSGIERRYTDTAIFINLNNVKYTAKGGLDAWNPYKYLNIWVDNMGGGLLGFAQFPSNNLPITYGAVIRYSAFGLTNTLPQYNMGATTTHEIGHCFNCYHIWGDDGIACTGTDYCNDTPNQGGYTLDPNPDVNGVIVDACTTTPPGIMYMDFMDYSRDVWKHNFTPNQQARMQALFTKPHGLLYQLTQSDGCVPPPFVCAVPGNLNTTSITENTAILNWDAVQYATGYNVQYRVAGGSWTTTATASTSLTIEGLIEGTNYEWQVQTNCGSGNTSAYSTVITFTTLGPCVNINAFEPNETLSAAALISTGVVINAGITSSTDLDWFKFSNTGSQKKIMVDLYDLPADYDIKLFTANGTQVGLSQNTGTLSEKITYNNGKVSTYYIEVYGHDATSYDPSNCYTLKASISSTNFSPMTNGILIDESNTSLLYSVYPNPASGIVNVEYNAAADGLLNISIFNVLGSRLTDTKNMVQKGLNNYQLDISNLQKGLYLLDINNGHDRTLVKLIVE